MGQGKAGTSGKDGKDGKDGRDGKPFTFGDLTPSQLEQLKGGPMGTMGPKGDGFNSPEGINYLKANTLWCADGNICQLPKDVPIGAATGVTAIKLNNHLEAQGANHIDVKNGAFHAGASRDTANFLSGDRFVMRNGGINLNNGSVVVNPGDKQNWLSKDELTVNNGHVNVRNGAFHAGTSNDTANYLGGNAFVMRNGHIRHAPGKMLCNSDASKCVDIGDIADIEKKNGIYRIRFPDGKCLDGGNFGPEGKGDWDCNNNEHQQWEWEPISGRLRNIGTGKCLRDNSGGWWELADCNYGQFEQQFHRQSHKLKRGTHHCYDKNTTSRRHGCDGSDNVNQDMVFIPWPWG